MRTCDCCGERMSHEMLTFDGLDICVGCIGLAKYKITGDSSYVLPLSKKEKEKDPMEAATDAFFDNGGEEVAKAVMEACEAEFWLDLDKLHYDLGEIIRYVDSPFDGATLTWVSAKCTESVEHIDRYRRYVMFPKTTSRGDANQLAIKAVEEVYADLKKAFDGCPIIEYMGDNLVNASMCTTESGRDVLLTVYSYSSGIKATGERVEGRGCRDTRTVHELLGITGDEPLRKWG